MARSFHKSFIAGIALAAILITALGAAQAQAQSRDTQRALAALLGLAVVGAIIADRRDDDRESQAVTRSRPHRWQDRDGSYRGVHPRPLPQRAQRQLLPRECLREVRTNRGRTLQVYSGPCMHRTYAFASSLPRSCARQVQGGRRADRPTVWGAHCLQQNGYRVSRR